MTSSNCEILNEIISQENECVLVAAKKIDKIKKTIVLVQGTHDQNVDAVEKSFGLVINKLLGWKEEYLKEVTQKNSEIISKLTSEKYFLEDSVNNLRKLIFSAKIHINTCTNQDLDETVLSYLHTLSPVITKLIEEPEVPNKPLKYIPTNATNFLKPNDQYKIGYIEYVPIDLKNLILVPKGQFFYGTLAILDIMLPDNLKCKELEQFCSWEVLLDLTKIEVEMIQTSNKFSIEFLLSKPGSYIINFLCYHQHIKGSPFSLQVNNGLQSQNPVNPEQHLNLNHQTIINGSSNQSSLQDLKTKLQQINESNPKLVKIPSPNAFRRVSTSPSSTNNGFQKPIEDMNHLAGTNINSLSSVKTSLNIDQEDKLQKSPKKLVCRTMCRLDKPLRRPFSTTLEMKSEAQDTTVAVPVANFLSTDIKSESEPNPEIPVEVPSPNFKPKFSSTHDPSSLSEKLKNLSTVSEMNASCDATSLHPGNKTVVFNNAIIKKEEIEDTVNDAIDNSGESDDMFNPSGIDPPKSRHSPIRFNNESKPGLEAEDSFHKLLLGKLIGKVEFCTQSSNNTVVMKSPIGVIQLTSGQIIVADTFNDRMLHFGPTGKFVKPFNATNRVQRPSAIVELGDGKFAVKDNSVIYIFSSDCIHIKSIGMKFLRRPYGLHRDVDGNLVTIEAGSDGDIVVLIICPNTGLLVRKGIVKRNLTKGQTEMSKPRFIHCHLPNTLHIVDLGLDMIFTVDMNSWVVVNAFGGSGAQNGKFRDPSGIVCDAEGYIIVGDSRNHRIQMFYCDGRFLKVLDLNRPLKRPSGLFLSDKGELLVLNYWENSLVKYKLAMKSE